MATTPLAGVPYPIEPGFAGIGRAAFQTRFWRWEMGAATPASALSSTPAGTMSEHRLPRIML